MFDFRFSNSPIPDLPTNTNTLQQQLAFTVAQQQHIYIMRAVNLAEHKDLIILWSQEHITAVNIISNLQTDFNITVALCTLQRRMQD
jgi:hypothetical protein